MFRSHKPVRLCHACLLNLGDHCWAYAHPRAQWQGRKQCPGFANEEVYAQFRLWQKQATAKTGRQLRQEAKGRPRRRFVFVLE